MYFPHNLSSDTEKKIQRAGSCLTQSCFKLKCGVACMPRVYGQGGWKCMFCVCLEKGELFYLSPSVTVFITLSVWVLKPTYLYKNFYFYVLPWTWILKRDRSTCRVFPQRVNKQWSGPCCLVLAAPVQSPRDFSETGPNKQTFLPAGSAPGRNGDKGGGWCLAARIRLHCQILLRGD